MRSRWIRFRIVDGRKVCKRGQAHSALVSNTYKKVVGDVELFEVTQFAYAGWQFAELVRACIRVSVASRHSALTQTEMREIGDLEKHTG